MKNNIFKKFTALLILSLCFGIIGCKESTKTSETSKTSQGNLATILSYKDSYVGDNSAVSNIIKNLPGNLYYKEMSLQTDSEPYEITIKYATFEKDTFTFKDNSTKTMDSSDVMLKNALITLSLIKNAEIINFNMDDGTIVTYEKSKLIDEYKNDFGDNLEEIIKDEPSLENFIKK